MEAEMATSLERFFADDKTRKFFLLFTPGGLETCVYFCHRRGRTPLTQVTHVFALCISDINDDDDDSSITFDPPLCSAEGRFQHLTMWMLALHFLKHDCPRKLVKHLPHRSAETWWQ